MSYDGKVSKYSFPFTNANATYSIRGPKGKAGLLYDYGVQGVSTAFAGTATPKASVGTIATPNAYGAPFDFGAVAVNTAKSVRSTYTPDQAAFDAAMVNRIIPADTDVVLSWTAATGGSPAGVGTAYCEIIWGT